MGITRDRLRDLVGLAERPITQLSVQTEERDGYITEHLRLDLGGQEIRGILTRPSKAQQKLPAILYGHSHGGGYRIGASELIEGREYLIDAPGPAFARAGYVTLCIDMPVFGERATISESAAAKALFWRGKSLWGQMLSDHASALSYLASRADVDATRIGAFGISMGCMLTYWLAAMDERIAAIAHLCCLADFRTMIDLGAHDGHGFYLVVPGLLEETDCGEIAGLVAPRPQLVCIGEADSLTPPAAVAKARGDVEAAYSAAPGKLEWISEPGIGHQETSRMREATLAFFGQHL